MTTDPRIPTSTVIELRQYTLRPGARAAFTALFDAELADPQEQAGIAVLGQFHDLDRPDMFVWLRGFPDMESRRHALRAFYEGPVWAAHRDEANGMMLDSDDVLLLRPAGPGPFPDARPEPRPTGASVFTVQVDPVATANTARFAQRYASVVAPALRAAGGNPLPLLASLHAVNTFPRLPIREHENVAVSRVSLADLATADRAASNRSCQDALASLDDLRTGPGQRLRLAPTPRSALR